MIEKALLLGLSTGVYCLGSCMPVLLPLTFGEKHLTIRARTRPLIVFSMGRLLAYTAFGAVVGFLGTQVRHPAVSVVVALSMIGLSILMIGYATVQGLPHIRPCRWILKSGHFRKLPFLMGILTGCNVCPPFLLAIQATYTGGGIGYGVGFFLLFFVATSIYLIPFIWIGGFSRFDQVRWVARVSAVVSGCLFFIAGLNLFAGI